MTTPIPALTGVEPSPPADGQYAYQENVLVTPDYAQQLIDANIENNRNLKESSITRYSRDMHKGFWQSQTGESIKISPEGKLIDGQNRMYAVIQADRPIVFDIAWNVSADRMLVIDNGSRRNTKDDFKISGTHAANNGGPVITWIIAWEGGNYLSHGGRLTPTRSEIRERYLKEPQAIDSAVLYGRYAHQSIPSMNATAAALAFWLFAKLDQEAAEKFFDGLMTGIDLSSTNPIASLRNRFIGLKPRELSRQEQLALLIRCWNAFRKPELAPVTGKVTLGRNPLSNDNFPKPI